MVIHYGSLLSSFGSQVELECHNDHPLKNRTSRIKTGDTTTGRRRFAALVLLKLLSAF
jgi:hypothetical protein